MLQLLWFFGFSLQSCSIGREGLNIHPIRREDLLRNGLLERRIEGERRISVEEENQPLIHELRSKLGRLRNEGFVDGDDPLHTDMKRHLMFVFYHWLVSKQRRTVIEDRVAYFRDLDDYENLLWRLSFDRTNDRVEFRLKSLFNQEFDPRYSDNLRRTRRGAAPFLNFDDGREKVHIDHLVRDDRVTIEIPEVLHKAKTRFIDNLTNIPIKKVQRNSVTYWKSRFGSESGRM